MRKSIIFLTIVGLIALLSYCKKDETRAVMLETSVAPTIQTVPNMTLQRAHGTDSLVFVCTPVDPGFAASANYYLEADTAGNQFQNAVVLASGIKDSEFKFTVSDLNGILIRRFPTDAVFAAELRVRSVLVATGSGPFVSNSETKSVNITTYGLPRLDLIGAGLNLKVESPLGDGNYSGFVKLDMANTFTFKDPDANIVYGDSAAALGVDGAAISVPKSGWYQVFVNTNARTYSVNSFMIGVVGDATVNGWNAPDQKMDYNAKTGNWVISLSLVNGSIKFRKNDDWGWNLGGTPNALVGDGANIAVTAGNYLITLTITNDLAKLGTYTITPN